MSVSFDRIAARYDATRGFPGGISDQIGKALVHEAALTYGARILEIGVGTGRVALPVTEYLEGLTYVGVDISREMMTTLRGKDSSGAIRLLQADATELPFPDRSFTTALAVHVLHLVSDPEQTLAELWRVVRPGGLFLHGYNDTEEDDRLHALRNTRWVSFVEESGGSLRHRARRSGFNDLIGHFFTPARTVTLATWEMPVTPRELLDRLTSRSPSDTWDIPDPIFNEAMQRTEAWAIEQFEDLDRTLVSTASFKIDVYER